MELLLIKTQIKEILKLVEPLAEYYRLNFKDITDYEKRVIYAEHLLASEMIRIASYLYANDPKEVDKTLPTFAEILKEIDSSTRYDKSKLLSEIELYIKNQPQGKKNLVITNNKKKCSYKRSRKWSYLALERLYAFRKRI